VIAKTPYALQDVFYAFYVDPIKHRKGEQTWRLK
jgi:hypothetical protein